MAIPLIFAAAGIVARYIAKRGIQAAVKKYTKKAVTNGKKHLKDLKSKPTANQITSASGTKGQRTYRAGQRNAFGVGVTGTATAAMLLSGGKEDKPTPRSKPKPAPSVTKPKSKPKPSPAITKPSPSTAKPKPKPTPSVTKPKPKPAPKKEADKKYNTVGQAQNAGQLYFYDRKSGVKKVAVTKEQLKKSGKTLTDWTNAEIKKRKSKK